MGWKVTMVRLERDMLMEYSISWGGRGNGWLRCVCLKWMARIKGSLFWISNNLACDEYGGLRCVVREWMVEIKSV